MSDQPAALKATFSNLRLIPSRKVCQIWLEIPIEEADAALGVLGGIPQPHSERWVAVARLNTNGSHIVEFVEAEPEPKEKRRWHDLKHAMQAGIRCSEPVFWRFIEEEYKAPAYNEDLAAKFVRRYCGVKSRTEINLTPSCAEAWERLESSYQAWLRVAE